MPFINSQLFITSEDFVVTFILRGNDIVALILRDNFLLCLTYLEHLTYLISGNKALMLNVQ